MPDPIAERPSDMKRRAWKLLLDASACASSIGYAHHEEIEGLRQEAKRLLDERARVQKHVTRAVHHPATHHSAEASGAQPGEPLEHFPRALRMTLLCLGVEMFQADHIVGRAEGAKSKAPGPYLGGKKVYCKKGEGKW